MFSYVDDWLMNRAEKISHKIQRTFGIVCFQMACAMFFVAILMMVVFIMSIDMDLGVMQIIMRCFSMTHSLRTSCFGYKVSLDLMHEYEKLKDPTGLMNGLKIICKLYRICSMYMMILIFILFTPLILIDVTFLFALVGVFASIAGEYFMACTPLPPQKSKMRQWIESFQKTLTPAFNAG